MRISDWSSDVCSSDLDAGAVLGDRHRHLAAGAGIAVADQAAVGLVGDVPEGDAGLGEEIGDRHEGRADDAEAVLDAMHLQHLHEGFFRRHLHLGNSFSWPWRPRRQRSEEHTSELQSLMRISYAVFCLKNKRTTDTTTTL